MAASPKSVRISNKFLAADADQASANNVMTCKQCNKRVYEMEKIVADSTVYHKQCFKCCHCKRILSLGNYTAAGGNKQLYCKPHFIELFRTKGNYEEGFGMEKITRPAGSDTFEGLLPGSGSSASKQKSPSKWEKPVSHAEVVNRNDNADGSHNGSDLPATSATTRDLMARYTTAAAGEGQVASPRAKEPVSTSELPEQGTTRALLAKFKEIQAGTNGGAKSPTTPKQPIKLVDDEADDRMAPALPLSPQPARISPEGSVAPSYDQRHHEPSPVSSPHVPVSPRTNGGGASALQYSQYDNDEEEPEEVHSSSVGHEDGGLLVSVRKDEQVPQHDISDEDEVERDIEGHGHHNMGQGHHDLGQGHYDEGYEHEGEGHSTAMHHVNEEYEEGQNYEEEDTRYAREDHHEASEGQLINFEDDQQGYGEEYEGQEASRQRESIPGSPGHHAAGGDDYYLEGDDGKERPPRNDYEEEE